MGRSIKGIIFIIVLLFLTTFGVKNNQPVQLKYYFNIMPIEIPLYALVYILLIIGVVIGLLIGFSKRFNQSKNIRGLQRENDELKFKVEALKKKKEETISKALSSDSSTEKPTKAAQEQEAGDTLV